MRIHFKFKQPTCTHQVLTLKGRYLTLKGQYLRRSRERYTCNTCGARVVRTLNQPASYLALDHHTASTSPFKPSGTAS
jgi:transposase-like protein